jgi:multicomponent Na+:H+ antiporter subunit A
MSGVLPLVALSGFVAALAAPALRRAAPRRAHWILALHPLVAFLALTTCAPAVAAGRTIRWSVPWAPSLGLDLSFCLDGLSLVFALLVTGIGALVAVYAGGYLAGHPHLGRFEALLFAFMSSMLGLVLADNVLLLFVFWELTSLASYLLIGFDHERAESRAAALQALLVTGVGGLGLLAGGLLLGASAGTFELSAILRGGAVAAGGVSDAALLLLALAAFTKSAQVPFHFWLPAAMAAPTPVSAYLHSATMVKAGVYLLARLHPALGGSPLWHVLLVSAGAATLVTGAALALRQTNMKRLLAYSTVAALGALTLLLGIGTPAAAAAAVVFLVSHAAYKGALFMVAGAVDHAAGTLDVARLSGLARAMPVTAVSAVLAALSMAGLPPFFGFVAKEQVFLAAWDVPFAAGVTAPLVVGQALLAAAAAIAIGPLLGRPAPGQRAAGEVSWSLRLGPLVLALAGLFAGLAPEAAGALVAAAATAVYGRPVEVALSPWHAPGAAFALGLATLLAGGVAWTLRGRVRALAGPRFAAASPTRLYGVALDTILGLARAQTRLLQSGYLRVYLAVVVASAVVLVVAALHRHGVALRAAPLDVHPPEAAAAVLILVAAVVAVRSTSRVAAVAALGVTGYGVALVYVLFGAPDLAMTQVLVDTLTVVLFVFVLRRLPRLIWRSSRGDRARDACVAGAAGVSIAVLIQVATALPLDGRISGFFAENAVPLAHGRNVVNVILVDFRGLDTLGEITVLAVAAIGVLALVRLRPGSEAA